MTPNHSFHSEYLNTLSDLKKKENELLQLKEEIKRRQLLILSEPDDIVRETMIENLIIDL